MDERVVEAIGRLMVESVGITTVALIQASPGLELSFPQWRALVVVGAAPDGKIRVGDIAKRIGSAVPTTSRLIRRLERRGLVLTERDEADRRATLVRLRACERKTIDPALPGLPVGTILEKRRVAHHNSTQ